MTFLLYWCYLALLARLPRRRRACVWCLDLAASRHAWLAADLLYYPLVEEAEDSPTARMKRTARLTREFARLTYATRPLWIIEAETQKVETPA